MAKASEFRLNVIVVGVFVSVFDVKSITFDIYMPSCGHPYGAFFLPGRPRNPWWVLKNHIFEIQALDSKPHHLFLRDRDPNNGDVPQRNDLKRQGLWYDDRALGSGWDLKLTLPLPDSGRVVQGSPLSLSGKVGGKDGLSAINNPGFITPVQVFCYKEITGVDLCGSEIELQEESKGGQLTLYIYAEQPFTATWGHQRSAIDSFANLLGLDMYLTAPLTQSKATKTGRKAQGSTEEDALQRMVLSWTILRNASSCAGGGTLGGA